MKKNKEKNNATTGGHCEVKCEMREREKEMTTTTMMMGM